LQNVTKKNTVKANELNYIKDSAAAALPFANQRVEDRVNDRIIELHDDDEPTVEHANLLCFFA
jgi:hypothetical protein